MGGLRWANVFSPKLQSRLISNCTVPGGVTWSFGGSKHTNSQILYGTAPSSDVATGSFDPQGGKGSVIGKGDALAFDTLPDQGAGPSFHLRDIGIELSGSRAYVTGRIVKSKTRFSSAGRSRLALIAHPKLFSGPARDKGKPPIADSFLMAVQGNATVAPALAAAMNRARCTGTFAGAGHGKIRTGTALGQVTVQALPMAATGLAGYLEFAASFKTRMDRTPIAVAPTEGTTVVTHDDENLLHFELPAGLKVPLLCGFGYKCEPSGGGYSLPGGFTLSYNGRSTTVSGLAVSYSGSQTSGFRSTMTGLLDGQPLTVGQDGERTDDFVSRVGAALGTDVDGIIDSFHATFTSTGPLE